MQTAIRAAQLIKRLVAQNEYGELSLFENPNIAGLPDWVVEAYSEHKFFMTCDDDYSGLWIALPIDYGQMGVAVRAAPSALLLYDEDERFIRVLAEMEYMV